MLKFSGYLTAALLAAAIAMPTVVNAAPPQKKGGAPAAHAAPRGGGGPHVTPHVGGGVPHFTARSGGAPHFTRHIGTPHVTHRTATVNRSLHITRPSHVTGSVTSNASTRRLRGQNNLAQPNATVLQSQPNLASTPNAHDRRGRHNGNGISTQAARQGRFASRFAARAQSDPNWRSDHIAARRAWRHGHRAGFVAWYGPVFWPYAYSDIFDYAFWPYGYDEGYWDYAYDDFVDGLFWGEYGPPEDYAYAQPCRPARELCRRAGAVQGAGHRHHRLAVRRDPAQSRP